MDKLWKGILNLREAVINYTSSLRYCCLDLQNGTVLFNEMPTVNGFFIKIVLDRELATPIRDIPTIWIEDFAKLHFCNTAALSYEQQCFLSKYLLFPLLPLKAQKKRRTIIIAHLAQTLDGKIATQTGHSKWIGNQENLIHAHRMRALCDGVLVGSKTLEEDQPKLTVRHVKGTDPIRIIVGNPTANFDSLIANGTTPIMTLHHKSIPQHPTVQYFKFDAVDNIIPTSEILDFLFSKGIHTVYMEGGATTISSFLEKNAIDILQLHIAPMIFGSGISGLQVPNVSLMEEAYTFAHHHFMPVGDAIMFSGFR